MTEQMKACESSILSMIVVESVEIGVEQARAWGWEGVKGEGLGPHSIRNVLWLKRYRPAANLYSDCDTWRELLKTKAVSKQAEEVSVKVSRGRIRGMPELRGECINREERSRGGGENEASQRSAATFQNRIASQEGALGRRQGRGADNGGCAARKDRGQNRAHRGELCSSGTRDRSQCMGLQEPVKQDELTDYPREGPERWPPRNMAKATASAGSTVGRAGRVYASCEPRGSHDRRCVDTYPGQCCGPMGCR
jgi:hypothetical protein